MWCVQCQLTRGLRGAAGDLFSVLDEILRALSWIQDQPKTKKASKSPVKYIAR
jgi:molecular chaperone GrpE (heat shock protein)